MGLKCTKAGCPNPVVYGVVMHLVGPGFEGQAMGAAVCDEHAAVIREEVWSDSAWEEMTAQLKAAGHVGYPIKEQSTFALVPLGPSDLNDGLLN